MSKADAQVIVDIVRDAVKSGEPLWVAVERKIAHNRSAMRGVRARMRKHKWMKPAFLAFDHKVLGRYKSLNRRIRRLRKLFVSWQMPDPNQAKPLEIYESHSQSLATNPESR